MSDTPKYLKSTAVDALGGYTYQLLRGLLALVKTTNKDTRIGIEVFDDVTIDEKGMITLEQDKKTKNTDSSPFSNLNENLWNTFDIWLSYLEHNDPNCSNTKFHLATNVRIKEKHFISELMKSNPNIDDCIDTIKDLCIKTKSTTVKKYIQNCISAKNLPQFKNILRNCSISDSNTEEKTIITEIQKHLSLPDQIDSERAFESILGWYIAKITNAIENDNEIWISRAEYNNAIASAIMEGNHHNIIGTPELEETPDKEFQALAHEETYIKQLTLIEIKDKTELESAIIDFYRFSLTKNRTEDTGEILPDQWNTEAIRLKELWQQTSQLTTRQEPPSIEAHKVGQKIYDNCRARSFAELPELNGNTRERFIVNGHYHVLADNEDIWWHPNYPDIKDT